MDQSAQHQLAERLCLPEGGGHPAVLRQQSPPCLYGVGIEECCGWVKDTLVIKLVCAPLSVHGTPARLRPSRTPYLVAPSPGTMCYDLVFKLKCEGARLPNQISNGNASISQTQHKGKRHRSQMFGFASSDSDFINNGNDNIALGFRFAFRHNKI